MQADVQSLMQGELGQWLASQVEMREAARKKAYNRWFMGGIALLPALAFLWFLPFSLGDFKGILSLIAIGGVGAWGYAPISEAKKAIKVGINSAIASSLGIAYEHDVTPGDEWDAARTYNLVPSCDRSSFEDRWHGDLEGHPFQLYEAHLEERRGSGKNRRWVTVFRGAVIDMSFGRSFHSTTLLQRKGKHKKWWGFGGRADNVTFAGHRLDYVDQVHPDFEGVFEVYSDDQVEARVLIHPSYVEHLLGLETAFRGEAVRALFRKGEVVIAVESGNLFESGSMNADDDHRLVAEAARQFGAMAKLALAINQNERGRVLANERPPSEPGAAPISQAARESAQRPAGGFGRKTT